MPHPLDHFRRFIVILAALLSIVLVSIFHDNPRLVNALNFYFPSKLHSQILVIGIDNASLKDYGRIDSWPRSLYAKAINTLQEAGAKTIGIDILLSDPTGADTSLRRALNQPNIVLATVPNDTPFWEDLPVTKGLSLLNSHFGLPIRKFQTAYTVDYKLSPSFARQVAVQSDKVTPLSTKPQLMRYIPLDQLSQHTISFKDLINGNVRFQDIQGRTVLIGMTATGLAGHQLPDLDNRTIPGVYMQARAISTLLDEPLQVFPLWGTIILAVLASVTAVLARGSWGLVIAIASIIPSIPLWTSGTIFPSLSVSFAALIGTLLVSLERWWLLRRMGTHDHLTGFGNRLAFTKAIEKRWSGRFNRPVSLILLDLSNFKKINEQYGRLAGDTLLKQLAERLHKIHKRSTKVFRWGPDEFAVLLENSPTSEAIQFNDELTQNLQGLNFQDIKVVVNTGVATSDFDIKTPRELIEVASRNRYRNRYERE